MDDVTCISKLMSKWQGYIVEDYVVISPKVSVQNLKTLLGSLQKKDNKSVDLFDHIVRINHDLSEVPRYMFYGRGEVTDVQIDQYEKAVEGNFFLGVG